MIYNYSLSSVAACWVSLACVLFSLVGSPRRHVPGTKTTDRDGRMRIEKGEAMSLLFRTAIRIPFTRLQFGLLQPTPNQRGWWAARFNPSLVCVGLGRAVLSVERIGAGETRRPLVTVEP